MIVVVTAMGMMGSAVGARLVKHGAVVRTSLSGRSGPSVARAARAGVVVCTDDDELFAGAEFVLSIVPPSVAIDVGESIAARLHARSATPVYVDCNAIAPPSLERIAASMRGAGVPFVDASIFGVPPKDEGTGPRFAVCGDVAARVVELRAFGLDVVDLGAPIGAASSLKMCTGALTKGLTALGAAVAAGAESHGIGEMYRAEMMRSQPELAAWLARQLPGMETKAQRWAAELDENAVFLDADPIAASVFDAIAAFYRSVAVG